MDMLGPDDVALLHGVLLGEELLEMLESTNVNQAGGQQEGQNVYVRPHDDNLCLNF